MWKSIKCVKHFGSKALESLFRRLSLPNAVIFFAIWTYLGLHHTLDLSFIFFRRVSEQVIPETKLRFVWKLIRSSECELKIVVLGVIVLPIPRSVNAKKVTLLSFMSLSSYNRRHSHCNTFKLFKVNLSLMTEFKEFCKACFTFDDVQEVLSNDYVIVPKISVATQRTRVSLDHYFTESYLKETLFQYFEIMLLSETGVSRTTWRNSLNQFIVNKGHTLSQ